MSAALQPFPLSTLSQRRQILSSLLLFLCFFVLHLPSHSLCLFLLLFLSLVKSVFSFGFHLLCMRDKAQSWLILSVPFFGQENKCECIKDSREMNIVSNPLSLVCCQYSPNCSLKSCHNGAIFCAVKCFSVLPVNSGVICLDLAH